MQANNKTTENQDSVETYLDGISDAGKRSDCVALIALITEQTGLPAKMWGTSIVGFGTYHYRYESGREGDAPLVGFSARKNAISLYLGSTFEQREALLARFGKHKTGKGCVYINRLADVDLAVLGHMVKNSIEATKLAYPD